MGFKESIDNGIDNLKKAGQNIKDEISEAGHRSAADAEAAKRELHGSTMTTTEKAGSVLNQGKELLLADVDKAKQDVRDDP